MPATPKPATKTVATPLDQIVVPATAPFGIPLLWGAKKVGKTLAALNSPWQPVHVIDTERSTYDYGLHQDRLIEMGVLSHPFTADYVDTFEEYLRAIERIIKGSEHYGTLVVDTFGQAAQWTGEDTFKQMGDRADKQSQIAWGQARDRLRKHILGVARQVRLLDSDGARARVSAKFAQVFATLQSGCVGTGLFLDSPNPRSKQAGARCGNPGCSSAVLPAQDQWVHADEVIAVHREAGRLEQPE